LLPLLYQVGLGFTPVQSGLLIMPQSMGAMCNKTIIDRILRRFAYRAVLVSNTVILGLLLVRHYRCAYAGLVHRDSGVDLREFHPASVQQYERAGLRRFDRTADEQRQFHREHNTAVLDQLWSGYQCSRVRAACVYARRCRIAAARSSIGRGQRKKCTVYDAGFPLWVMELVLSPKNGKRKQFCFRLGVAGLMTALFVPNRATASSLEMIDGVHKALTTLAVLTICSTLVVGSLRGGDGSNGSSDKMLHPA
jgi:hypothetical protein